MMQPLAGAEALIPLLEIVFVITLVVIIIRIAVGGALKDHSFRNRPTEYLPPVPTSAFPVIPLEPPSSADGRPGHFKITGVDRETRLDTTWYCDAESEANARVKAELEGIIVTGVEWAATAPSEPEPPKREPFRPTHHR